MKTMNRLMGPELIRMCVIKEKPPGKARRNAGARAQYG